MQVPQQCSYHSRQKHKDTIKHRSCLNDSGLDLHPMPASLTAHLIADDWESKQDSGRMLLSSARITKKKNQ